MYNDTIKKEVRKRLRKTITPHEALLWRRIRRNALGVHFRRQYSVGTYILDFYAPTCRLAIELDGSQHGWEENIHADNTRTAFLATKNIAVLRFTNNDVYQNIENVLTAIECEISTLNKYKNTPS